MYFLYVSIIYLLTIFKIAYETIIYLLVLLVIMASTVLLTEDKAFFTKKYKSFKRTVGLKDDL